MGQRRDKREKLIKGQMEDPTASFTKASSDLL
jgi:hypothetical protein